MLKARYSKKGIVLMCTVAYFASYFSRKTFSVLMVEMIKNGAIERDIAGIVGTALFIFYGAGQLVSGYLGDKFSPKYLMFAGLVISAICNLAIPLVPNQYLMIPIWATNGFAQALLWPPIVRILSDNLSHEKYVTANLIVTCGAHISTILLYVYAPICISFMSWQSVFYTSTIFCVVVGILFLASMSIILNSSDIKKASKEPLQSTQINAKQDSLLKTFSSSGVILIFVCIIAMGFMRDGIESWLPTLYSEAFGRDSKESILVSVALPIFAIISLFVVRIIHKGKVFNNEARGAGIIFAISAVLCIPLAILINVENTACRIICLFLAVITCACMHSCNFLLISCVPGRFAKRGRASTIGGFCNACTYIGAAGSMYGIALISKHLGWSATIISWIAILVIGLIFSILSFKKYTAFLKDE
ncbi:MAG: MFS transporter [Clostridia bacterium]|nr:MFS transporter [Clostridia bacterium]